MLRMYSGSRASRSASAPRMRASEESGSIGSDRGVLFSVRTGMLASSTLPAYPPSPGGRVLDSIAAVQTRTIELDTPDGRMPLYEAIPDAPARAAVIVIQEAYGVNDYIERVARDLADAG